MKNLNTVCLVIVLFACQNSASQLSKKIQENDSNAKTLSNKTISKVYSINFISDNGVLFKRENIKVSFAAIPCDCPQWVITDPDSKEINGEMIFLERGDSLLTIADTLLKSHELPLNIVLQGNFYSRPGYPFDHTYIKGFPTPARVFRYTKLNIVKE